MPIFSNINTAGAGVANGGLVPIYDTKEAYADALVGTFGKGLNNSGSDHFVGCLTDLTELGEFCDPARIVNDAGFNSAFQRIQSSDKLCKWLAGVLCAFIYGCEGSNKIHVFESLIDSNAAFLSIWRDKFAFEDAFGNRGNDNGDDGRYFNIVSMSASNDYHDWLGCYSKRFLLIPIQEYELGSDTDRSRYPEWKKKFFELYKAFKQRGVKEVIEGGDGEDDILTRTQRIMILLSARSINSPRLSGAPAKPANKTMLLLKKILTERLNIGGLELPNNLAHYLEFGDILFYKTSSIFGKFWQPTIFVGVDGRDKFYATYPFTPSLIEMIKNQAVDIKDIRLKVTKDVEGKMIDSVEISYQIGSTITFVPEDAGNMPPMVQTNFNFFVPGKQRYDADHIVGITRMRTFCMYPNMPLETEKKCKRFTYLSNSSSFFMKGRPGTKATVDLSSGDFICTTEPNKQVRLFTADAVDQSLQVVNTKIEGRTVAIATRTATVSEHFIKVVDHSGTECGYIVNLKRLDAEDVPAVLRESTLSSLSFKNAQIPPKTNEFSAFVDFGSSSSCVTFRQNKAADLLRNSSLEQCTLRSLLTPFDKTSYDLILNNPVENNKYKFPSVAVIYDPEHGIPSYRADDGNTYSEYMPYMFSWMPIVDGMSKYIGNGVDLRDSHKVELGVQAGASKPEPNIIVTNLCYIIACNAAANNFDDVIIVPSLPSLNYKDALNEVWESSIRIVQRLFDIRIQKAIDVHTGVHYLYESVAIAVGAAAAAGIGANTLEVSIDIGDGTTDMSAVYVDSTTTMHLCGYSSLEYAGQDMIKTTIKDVLTHTSFKQAQTIFKNASGYGKTLFEPKDPSKQDEYGIIVDNLLRNFFDDNGTFRGGRVESFWQNNVVDLLSISSMRTNDIDQKIAANYILRYLLLLPVIKDFIMTSCKIAGSLPKVPDGDKTTRPAEGVSLDKDTNIPWVNLNGINIHFFGGASKGINTIHALDTRPGDRILQYFIDSLGMQNININISQKDGKDILVESLADLKVDMSAQDVQPGAALAVSPITEQDWNYYIDPRTFEYMGKNVHRFAEGFDFAAGNVGTDKTTNRSKVRAPSSYFPGGISDAQQQFVDYFNNEIYAKLIDNGDEWDDVIEVLLKNFTSNASGSMKADFGSFSFSKYEQKAADCYIYPEMVKSAIFMYTASELLTKYHGVIPNVRIKTPADAGDYPFGG